MNQPTKDEFEDLKERVKKLEEQQTEPIQITVERRHPDRELLQEISRKQDEHARLLLAHSRSVSTLQTDMEGVKADVKAIRESQADFRDALKTMATKDDVTHLESLIKQLLPPKPPEGQP